MHIAKVIQQLGYSSRQAKVYLATLAMGEGTISDIAKRVNIPRTSVQLIVEGLRAHNLMSSYTKHRYRYWVAESPERLFTKEQERIALLKALPELVALRPRGVGKPSVRVCMGSEDIKLILDDIIATRQSVRAIISWDEWIESLGTRYVGDYVERRAQHFLHMRLLVPRAPSTGHLKHEDQRVLRTTRFLPKHVTLHTSMLIYAEKVALITLNKKQPMGVLIEDADIRHTMDVFFEDLWRQGA